jgi:hypothetical protein
MTTQNTNPYVLGEELTLYDYLNKNPTVLWKYEQFKDYGYSLDEFISEISLLYRGTNDYRNIKIGEPIFIPPSSSWGEGVLGNGLYFTPNINTARDYGRGFATTLINGGNGCVKDILLLTIKIEETDKTIVDSLKNTYGICLNPKNNYLNDEWNELIKNKEFIVGYEGDGTEIVFIQNIGGKITYSDVTREFDDANLCGKPYNDTLGTIKSAEFMRDFNTKEQHACVTNGTQCPSTCQYLSEKGRLPQTFNNDKKNAIINCNTGEYDEIQSASVIQNQTAGYYDKYIKYKAKYLNLKKHKIIYN